MKKVTVALSFFVLLGASQRTKAGVLANIPCSLTAPAVVAGFGAMAFAWYKGAPKYAAPLFGAATYGTFGIVSWLFCQNPGEAATIKFCQETNNAKPPQEAVKYLENIAANNDKKARTEKLNKVLPLLKKQTEQERLAAVNAPAIAVIFLKNILQAEQKPEPQEFINENPAFKKALGTIKRARAQTIQKLWKQAKDTAAQGLNVTDQQKNQLDSYFKVVSRIKITDQNKKHKRLADCSRTSSKSFETKN